ncbi:hypothetical protein [Streptomyces sp. bgisy100]|uniref:hypothetical protein n=1 Tax=Streptomyces sp. bgisy100 TaxID=3413783 RepID=UPI003D74F4AC
MISPVERALAKARLQPRPYTEAELEAAEIRIAVRAVDRMLNGALSFDDEMRHARDETGPPRPSAPSRPLPRWEQQLRAEAARDLKNLCRAVVEQEGALHQMSTFLSLRILEPDGARVLGCVLQLATREDSARFWWQFAAGAGDTAATYCLYLHHMSLGETWEADWWFTQASPEDAARDDNGPRDTPDLALSLRLLGLLAADRVHMSAATSAVIDYVPGAVEFVDEVDLPLPEPDFARHIEELTATT